MQKLPEAIQLTFFQVFNNEINIDEFERWLYSNNELEGLLGESIYVDLISINYKEPHCRYNMQRLIYDYLDWAKFEERKLRQTLNALKKDNAEFVNALVESYDLYCDGYRFMEDIGMGYGLGFGINHDFEPRQRELTESEQTYIKKYGKEIAIKAADILELLNTGKIIIKPKNNDIDERWIWYNYEDHRSPEELTHEAIKKVEADISHNSLISRLKRFFGG